MNNPEEFKTEQIRDWWSSQAKANPDTAGILTVFAGDKWTQLYRQKAEWLHLLHLTHFHEKMRVLELGCGAGRWSFLMAPHVGSVVAVDFSDEMIRLAEQRKSKSGAKNIEFVISAAQEFSRKEQFDLIYLSGVDQYLDDAAFRATIHNASTMLAKNGMLIDRVTISRTQRSFLDEKNGYKSIYRTLPELQSAFSEFEFRLEYHKPTHDQMRLPGRWQTEPFLCKVEWALENYPRCACFLIESITRILDRLRPVPRGPVDRSHDFLLFKKQT